VGMTNQPVLLAYRTVGTDFNVQLAMTRHKDVEVLLTLVDSAVYTALQTPDGRRITQVVFAVRNNGNQYLSLNLPKEAEVWSVLVAGNPVRPVADKAEGLLIPLVRSQAAARSLAAFPIEVVYVETPKVDAEKGWMETKLPVTPVPVTHVMYNLFVPKEASYGWWEGSLRHVEDFTAIQTGGVEAPQPPTDARELAQKAARRAEEAAMARGLAPIRVDMPMAGKHYKFEKILVFKDELWFKYWYNGWQK